MARTYCSNRHFKTDAIFHEKTLGKIEDCIYQSKLTDEQKDALAKILYSEFYHTRETKNAIKI